MTVNYKGNVIRAVSTLGLGGVDISEWPILADDVAAIKSNIGLNTALTIGLLAVTQYNLVDGIANAFADEANIDLSSSSDQLYDAAGDFYTNRHPQVLVPGATGTIITDMTFANREALAFDGILGSQAVASPDSTYAVGHIGKDWGAGNERIINGFKAWGVDGSGFKVGSGQITLTLQGSTDNFSSSIVDLGNMTFADDSANPQTERTKLTGITETTAYRYHRLRISHDQSANWIQLSELEFYGPVIKNMAVESTSVTADAVPTEALLSFMITPVDTISVNTDVLGYVSRDGGATFTQVTLSEAVAGFPWQRLLTGPVDISGQAPGTSMRWRLVSANNVEFNFDNVSLFWN